MESVNRIDIMKMILNGEGDLTTLCRLWGTDLELTSAVEITKIFIVVPCRKEIAIGEVYRGLRNNFLIVLGIYIVFTVVETLLEAASCRIFGRSYRFRYSNLFINLNAFSGALGLPINVNRNRRSISLYQILMVMSIFSLIANCFFNANLSTLLTKRPVDQSITNYKELRNSGLKVIFEESFREIIENDIRQNYLRIHQKQAVYMLNSKRIQMLFSQNPVLRLSFLPNYGMPYKFSRPNTKGSSYVVLLG